MDCEDWRMQFASIRKRSNKRTVEKGGPRRPRQGRDKYWKSNKARVIGPSIRSVPVYTKPERPHRDGETIDFFLGSLGREIKSHSSPKLCSVMSFGGPGGRQASFKPTPPQRGSFPLDHDGDCKPIIAGYLKCLRLVRGQNDEKCRMMAKEYLKCRMEHNLMASDTMKNLGFEEDEKPTATGASSTT